jgi:hypothetical protein
MTLPAPETMLAYASILEKPQYAIHKGIKYALATGEIVEAACEALRICAAQDGPGRDLIDGGIAAWIESMPTDAEIRNGIIEECAHAAFKAYGSITSDQYVLEGPAGLARRMINSIKALSLPSTTCGGRSKTMTRVAPADGGGK